MSINLYKLDAISAMLDNDQKEIKGLAEMFLEFVPGMMNDLLKAIDNQDWNEAGRQAHKLKSTLKIWQIDALADDIYFIEVNGKHEDNTSEIIEKGKHVEEVLHTVMDQIKVDFKL